MHSCLFSKSPEFPTLYYWIFLGGVSMRFWGVVDSRIMVCALVPKAGSAKLFDVLVPCLSFSGWSLPSSEGP